MLTRERFVVLLEKYALDEISPAERSEFLAGAQSGDFDDLLLQHIEKSLQRPTDHPGLANLPPHRAADILHKILSSEEQNAVLLPKNSIKRKIIRWAAAAAIAGLSVIAIYYFRHTDKGDPVPLAKLTKDMQEKINETDQPLKITMEEGSVITLQPGSLIHYPTHFVADKREIFLDGEAFFEVTRNTSRPFFVYNKNIVTHVLGTSFNMKMNKETKQLEVFVRSGRVEVYENKPAAKISTGKKNNGVILLPNQKVVYDEDTRQFVPSLVDIPLPIVSEINDKKSPAEAVAFEHTPLSTVLTILEKSYGIEIEVETENIYKCLFTGDVSQQDLYARLDIICQSVQASYEIKGTRILIKGKGCN